MIKQEKTKAKIDEINQKLWSNRFNNPQAILDEVTENLSHAIKISYKKGIAYAKLNIAAACFLQSKNDLSLENLADAIIWFTENKTESGYSKALYLKGNIYESFGDYEKALEYCLKSLEFSSDANDRETEAEAASQLGLIYTRIHNFQKALEYYYHGLKIREELHDENAIASSLNRIGMVMRLIKKYDESLQYYFKSLEIRESNKQETSIPWTLLGIASTYEDMGKTDEALAFYERGIEGGDIRCSLQCIMGSGRILSLKGHHDKAELRLMESLKMASDLKALSLISDAYSALSVHYELTRQAEKALLNYKMYQETRESLQSEEAQSRFRNIEISHAIEKSEQEKEIFRLRHVELKQAYDIIDEKNNDITASINYAKRIQNAILPKPSEIHELENNIFILYHPKDIISGDFYWFSKTGEKLIIVAGDCTGHGVPGALMSMLGISFLEEIINNREIVDSGMILDALSQEVKRALRQKGEKEDTRDGMDIAICVIDSDKRIIQYSGAYNSMYIVRNNDLIEFHADRMPVGYFNDSQKKFSTQNIDLHTGDIIYMFSDGYADQFGGPNNKKFKYSTFKQLLVKIHTLPLNKQKELLEQEFLSWKADYPQLDDVLVMGMKL